MFVLFSLVFIFYFRFTEKVQRYSILQSFHIPFIQIPLVLYTYICPFLSILTASTQVQALGLFNNIPPTWSSCFQPKKLNSPTLGPNQVLQTQMPTSEWACVKQAGLTKGSSGVCSKLESKCSVQREQSLLTSSPLFPMGTLTQRARSSSF